MLTFVHIVSRHSEIPSVSARLLRFDPSIAAVVFFDVPVNVVIRSAGDGTVWWPNLQG